MEEVLFKLTGNPFVDAGIWAICEWKGGKKPEEITIDDLKETIKDVLHDVYLTKKWSKTFYSIFPNNAITNPSVKDKEERYSKFLLELVDSITPLGDSGNCISCGRRETDKYRTKKEIPLLGSGAMINYFPGGQSGADYCPACTFAVQFSPLVMYSCRRLLLLHSNSEKVMRHWSNKAIQDVRRQILTKDFNGCFNEKYVNPVNALFHIIQDIVLTYNEEWEKEKPSITLYHFTNYIQDPDLDLFHLPNNVFHFLTHIQDKTYHSQWQQILKKGYVKVNWDKVKSDDDYKNKRNRVYFNLLNGRSITSFFFDRKSRKVFASWELLTYYLMEVRNMDEKRIETIKRVGDEIATFIEKTDNIKRLRQMEQASKYESFRRVLIKIIKNRLETKEEKPLFTLDEYVTDLIPDYRGWKETQDLLLFRIYEKLHDWLKKSEHAIEKDEETKKIKEDT